MNNKKQLGMILLIFVVCFAIVMILVNNANKKHASEKEKFESSSEIQQEESSTLDNPENDANEESTTQALVENNSVYEEDTTVSEQESTTEQENTTEQTVGTTENATTTESEATTEEYSDNEYIELPYGIGDTGLIITKIGSYSGIYVEDGTNDEVKNVLAMTVKNTSNKTIEYSEYSLAVSNGKMAEFKITLLPPGEEVVVFEQKRLKYNKKNRYEFQNEITAYLPDEKMTVLEDKVSLVATNENTLTVTNLTEEEIDTLRVFYKYQYEDGTFVGGITFTCKLENIKGKGSITVSPAHFETEGCKIIRVEEYNE